MPIDVPKLDAVDKKLLLALQKDARATMGELAELVSLSPSPCWRRVKQLEESGLIEGYNACLSRQKLGYGVTGFVQLQMDNHTPQASDSFERAVVALSQVLSCHNLSGRYDYLLEVVGVDLESFAEFVRTRIRALPGVREISTSFSLKEVKRSVALPIG
ncbi:leucine-responsive regulatory protein [mine drainage metagenome]|uniref:Leucine-responsive regulatory protein n=1 Tax=mine drainage metagenome TaxID=410659 RepID=A0A1J5PN70_9ZZZZ